MLVYQYDISWPEIPRRIQGARESLTITEVDTFLRATYDVPSSSSYRITSPRESETNISVLGPTI